MILSHCLRITACDDAFYPIYFRLFCLPSKDTVQYTLCYLYKKNQKQFLLHFV